MVEVKYMFFTICMNSTCVYIYIYISFCGKK